MLNKYLIHNSEIASSIIEGEVIVVTLKDSILYSLNEVASRIWKLSKKGNFKISEIIKKIVEEFEVDEKEAEKDILEFIKIMISKKMIEVKNEPFKSYN